MVCVKYCVFTFPLVVTAVQTHGGVQSALRSIHAPTRNEEGTYIRASVASDLDTLSTPSTPNHQMMMMDIFLLGGWHARVLFILWLSCVRLVLFCLVCVVCVVYVVYVVALSFVVALPVLGRNVPTGRTLPPVFLYLTCLYLVTLYFLVYLAFMHRLVKSINDFPHNE